MSSTTLNQRRAAYALQQILTLQGKSEAENYVSYVKSLPATIYQNGLGPSLATLLAAAKGKNDAHRVLYNHINQWLCADSDDAVFRKTPDVLEAVIANDQELYIHAQAEALAFLEWLKKFAVAYLSESSKGK